MCLVRSLLFLTQSFGSWILVLTTGISQLLVQLFIFLLLGNFLFFVDQYLKQISQDLDTFLYFSFNQIEHAFRKVLIQLHPLARQVVIGGTLKAKVRFIIIFLLQSELSDLEQSITGVKLLLRVFCNLFEMKDSFFFFRKAILYSFCQQLADVKVGLHI